MKTNLLVYYNKQTRLHEVIFRKIFDAIFEILPK